MTLVLAVGLSVGASQPSNAFDLRSLWPFGRDEAEKEPIPDPVPYKVRFEVVGDTDRGLTKDLRNASGLVSEEETPPSGLVGLIARARDDLSTLTAVLYENARYAGQIDITIAGRPLEAVSPFDPIASRPVPVAVRISPGPPFTLGQVEAGPLPPDTTLEDLGLVSGETAGSAEILAAETALADAWRERGHPLVSTLPRNVVADHDSRTVDVAIAVDPGPAAEFGQVSVSGTERVNPTLIAGRAGLEERGLYNPTAVKRAEQRLRDLGVFESVRISPAESLAPDGSIPMLITVSERPRRVIGASATYSSNEGAGLEAYWAHRNLFGGAEQLRFSFEVSRLFDAAFDDPDFRLAATFKKPAVFDPMTDFTLRLETYRETTDSYRTTAAVAEAGLTRIISDTLTGGLAFEIERSQTDDPLFSGDHLLTTVTGTLEWDTRDDRLNPSEGFRAKLLAAPSYDFLQETGFATFRADYSTYYAFGETGRLVAATRIGGAIITVDDIANVAANRRLYAGGGGSVRGYGFKNLGPRTADGEVIGGRSLIEASAELRYRLNDSFGLAAFIDAGNAYEDYVPDFGDLKFGVGVGLRYLTPVGPLRFDVAFPLDPGPDDPDVALYVGLGQAF